jgi:hypothetical protein
MNSALELYNDQFPVISKDNTSGAPHTHLIYKPNYNNKIYLYLNTTLNFLFS